MSPEIIPKWPIMAFSFASASRELDFFFQQCSEMPVELYHFCGMIFELKNQSSSVRTVRSSFPIELSFLLICVDFWLPGGNVKPGHGKCGILEAKILKIAG